MIIDPSSLLQTSFQRRLYRVVAPLIERSLSIRDFDGIYQRTRELYSVHPDGPSVFAWFDAIMQATHTHYKVDHPNDFEVPAKGPLIIVSNHPFGILDPCILAHFASKVRPDLKLMANSLLSSMPELRPWIIPVDPLGGDDSTHRNLAAMKEAVRHLRAGGALAIFPSGEVAHYQPGKGIEESVWSPHIGALVRRTNATVLPAFFPGGNSVLFHAAGLVHRRLRTGLLFREFCHPREKEATLRVGHAIPFTRLRKFEDDENLTRYVRLHTMVLAKRRRLESPGQAAVDNRGEFRPALLPSNDRLTPEVRTANTAQSQIHHLEEVAALRASGGLITAQGNFSVYCASSRQIPRLLQEIGRLREEAFRAVGEGTGQEIDLDRFDQYYLHLFLWDEAQGQIAGAYRLGQADLILREYGRKGLYTSTLFKFEKPFLATLESAVEMGRSFIRPSYQKNLSALPLLWKGIAQWMGMNPRYKKLFGPVSISQDYDALSRKMIVEFLEEQRMQRELACLVKARRPFRYMRNRKLMREFISANLKDVEDCSALVSSLETDGKGIPVLLKHYLRLNGTILSFNVDKAFSSALDGLILVDLTQTDPKLLAKYMGEERCRAYLAAHGASLP